MNTQPSKKRILILGTYPIVQARHGGALRAKAVVAEYERQGRPVHYVAVFRRSSFPNRSLRDIAVGMETDRAIHRRPELEDVLCGRAIMDDAKVKAALTKELLSFKPDIIQLEQIYPYLGLKALLVELGLNPVLIFDAHNVESLMKAEVYERQSTGDAGLIAEIEVAERDLASRAALMWAVSHEDVVVYREYGAKTVVVAPNGSFRRPASRTAQEYWRGRPALARINHALAFISSAHLPNWYGFKAMVGEELGYLPPDTRIVMGGELSNYLKKQYERPKTPPQLAFLRRVVFGGRVSDDRLAGLLEVSEVILLPITSGGGSSLKTAEALLAGKKIVATPFAFRSFEQYRDYPGIWLAATQAEFQQAITAAMAAPPVVERTAEQVAALSGLQWSACLREAVGEAVKI